MPDLVDRVIEKMAGRSQGQFAAHIGVDQSTVSRFLSREIGLGPRLAGALASRYPELIIEIGAFFSGANMHQANEVNASSQDSQSIPAPETAEIAR